MKGWLINDDNKLELKEIVNDSNSLYENNEKLVKVKMTKALIGIADVLRYMNEFDAKNIVLGSAGIGLVKEDTDDDGIYSFEKGSRVYINPFIACGECHHCRKNVKTQCANCKIAGEDYNGFLLEELSADVSSLHLIPESISDTEALFIEPVSRSLSIIDRLNIQKGEHVVIFGASNLGIILAQMLKYYQSIPILLDNDAEKIERARECGIYYSIEKERDWLKEISDITGGKLAPKIIYLQESKLPLKQAFTLGGYNSDIAISGYGKGSNIVSFNEAMKKEIKIYFVNTSYGNTEASINIIANKAIDLSNLPINEVNFDDCDKTFASLADNVNADETVNETIVNFNK